MKRRPPTYYGFPGQPSSPFPDGYAGPTRKRRRRPPGTTQLELPQGTDKPVSVRRSVEPAEVPRSPLPPEIVKLLDPGHEGLGRAALAGLLSTIRPERYPMPDALPERRAYIVARTRAIARRTNRPELAWPFIRSFRRRFL